MKYRRKELNIEAIKFTNTDLNVEEIKNFLGVSRIKISYENPYIPIMILNEKEELYCPKGYYIAKTQLNQILIISPAEFQRDYELVEEK